MAAAARAKNPGITVHFRLFVIADLGGKISEWIVQLCERFHKGGTAGAKDDPSTYLVGRRGSRHGWLPVGRFDKYLVPTGAVKAAPVAGSEER